VMCREAASAIRLHAISSGMWRVISMASSLSPSLQFYASGLRTVLSGRKGGGLYRLQPCHEKHDLPEKDLPILQAACGSNCQFLITGDITQFGHFIGTEIQDVRVLTVGRFLAHADGPST
jgi:hypothetical protein